LLVTLSDALPQTVDGVAYSLSTLAISVACLYLGYHVSSLLPTLPSRRSDPKRTPLVDCLFLLSAVLSYLVALLLYFLGPTFWRHRAIFALLLAPPGAMLRYLLALLNSLAPVSGRFPLGTFMANMTATLIIAGVYAAQHRPPAYSMPVRCDALYALQQGFCGCLSTVSTFAFEITTLTRRRWRWIYLWTSVVLGHIFVLAVLGGVKWGEGIGAVCTGSDGPRSVTGTPI
jgi:fluoride ion exporter CrcB/FEX